VLGNTVDRNVITSNPELLFEILKTTFTRKCNLMQSIEASPVLHLVHLIDTLPMIIGLFSVWIYYISVT
jgi:hypothetical protein